MRAPRTLMSTTTTGVTPKRPVAGSVRCTRATRRLRVIGVKRNDKQKGRDCARPFRQSGMKFSSVLDRAMQVEGPFAACAVVNAVDGRRSQRLLVLGLERCGVAALIVEDRAIRKERRTTVRAAGPGGFLC